MEHKYFIGGLFIGWILGYIFLCARIWYLKKKIKEIKSEVSNIRWRLIDIRDADMFSLGSIDNEQSSARPNTSSTMKDFTKYEKSKPLTEGRTKSNIKNINCNRRACPPPPAKR